MDKERREVYDLKAEMAPQLAARRTWKLPVPPEHEDTADVVSSQIMLPSGETRAEFMDNMNEELLETHFEMIDYAAIYPLRLFADDMRLRIYRVCVFILDQEGVSRKAIAVVYRFSDNDVKLYVTPLMATSENAGEGEKKNGRIPLDKYHHVAVNEPYIAFSNHYLISSDPISLSLERRAITETLIFTNDYEDLIHYGSTSSIKVNADSYLTYERSLPPRKGDGNDEKEHALALLHHAAEESDIEAMFYLGCHYNKVDEPGRNPVNMRKARKWWEKAAGLGLIRAMKHLIRWHELEFLFPCASNTNEKDEIHKKVAGYWQGQADILAEGRKKRYAGDALDGFSDPILNPDEKCFWLLRAAEAGQVDAMRDVADAYRTGNMYVGGRRLEPDYGKAVYWYEKEALGGGGHYGGKVNYSIALYDLWRRYRDGTDGLEKDMDRAMHWLQESAMAGYEDAQIQLGDMYYNGEWFEQDKTKAAYWYDKGADRYVEYRFEEDRLDHKLMAKLYRMYRGLDEIEPNPKRAEHFRKRLIELGRSSLLDETPNVHGT